MRMRENDENKLVRRIGGTLGRSRTASAGILLGSGDDAALFRPRIGQEVILTCDWFLEGTHFLREKHPPSSVGWKCLARAVSDIAAMGGVPRCFLLSIALPSLHTGGWLDQFLSGLSCASRKFRCVLAGGDTTRRSQILINVTAVGEVREGNALLRSGARPGDLVYVSGRLGEAELGLQLLRRNRQRASSKDPCMKKHLYPEPRLALGQWLAQKRLATAMMDLSDGLSSDLPRLCAASGAGARLEAAKIPVTRASNRNRKDRAAAFHLALHGGDDYELLFTVPTRKAKLLPHAFQGVILTAIGEITRESRLLLHTEDGRERPLVIGGWDPFRKAR